MKRFLAYLPGLLLFSGCYTALYPPPEYYQQVAPPERVGHKGSKRVAIVASHRLGLQCNPNLIEPIGDEQRIGVEKGGSQQLAAHRNDLGLHENQPGAK